MRHRAFTLVEVLVSVAIFALVATALLGVYATSTELVRLGESRRVAADEAVAALAKLDGDLARIVPYENHGFFCCQAPPSIVTNNSTWYPGGSMAIAFLVADPGGVTQRATGAGLSLESSAVRLVMWMVNKDGVLIRREGIVPGSNRWNTVCGWFDDALTASSGDHVQEVARGCLLLAVDAAPGSIAVGALSTPTPSGSSVFCTEMNDPPRNSNDPPQLTSVQPFPAALRLTVAFSGGDERSTRGRLVQVGGGSSPNFRVAGVRSMPLQATVRYERADHTRGWVQLAAQGGGVWKADAATDLREPTPLEYDQLNRADIVVPSLYTITRTVGR